MAVKYESLKEYAISFKNLISGPAMPGRILNYLIYAGKGELKHKNGHRGAIENNVGDAWCTEFMCGLGLVYYEEDPSTKEYPLKLTNSGEQLYQLIKGYPDNFDEGSNVEKCREQLTQYSQKTYDFFFEIFKATPVCINLVKYCLNKNTIAFRKSEFDDAYFKEFKKYYKGEDDSFVSKAKTNAATTGDNRVASLRQLCEFFNCLKISGEWIVFDIVKLSKSSREIEIEIIGNSTRKYSKEQLIAILTDMYNKDGQPGEKNSQITAIHMFFIKYGDVTKEHGITVKELCNAAGISPTMESELYSGIRAYNAIKDNKYGVKFYNKVDAEIQPKYETSCQKLDFEWNRIVFGAPGTGKSHLLDEQRTVFGENFERVTFHPDYTYSQFVGTYKPHMKPNGDIEYAFVPGPLVRILTKAYISSCSSTPQPMLLLIEEINRANVAAVFGDTFQLLDRKNGVSQFPIQISEDLKDYFKDKLGMDLETIVFPDNLYIWATMNSADQGVFPMDTAFKRRWSFEYIGIDNKEDQISQFEYSIAGKTIKWNNIRKAINDWMSSEGINEDKQMGPFFISKQFLESIDGKTNQDELFVKQFKDKVLMYLFEDACRSKRERLFATFSGEDKNYKKKYSAVCDLFEKKGIQVFNEEIVKHFNELT